MNQRVPVYSCGVCGQMVTLVHRGGGRLVCCNRPMQQADERHTAPAEPVPNSAPYWRCSNCRYLLQAVAPPEVCPSCSQSCRFEDVTCYIPECGFTGIDNRLA